MHLKNKNKLNLDKWLPNNFDNKKELCFLFPRYTNGEYTGYISVFGGTTYKYSFENDNLVLEIVGLGRCTTKMLEYALDDKVEDVDSFNTDSASAYRKFCKKHNIKLNAIP